MNDNRITFGIVGTGGIFYGWGDGSGHLPACPWVVEEGRLSALCDVNENNLNRAAAAVGKLYRDQAGAYRASGRGDIAELLEDDSRNLKLYTSLDDMLKSGKPDFIDIITPCEHHAGAVRKAAAAGCSILCEKPLARTWPEAEELVECVDRSGIIFLYGENLIYADPYHDVRKLILKGEIGELDTIRIPFSISEPGNYGYARGGVGALLDNGIHAITLAWFLVGFDYVPEKVRTLRPDGISTRIGQRLVDGALRDLQVEDYANFAIGFVHPETGRWVNAYLEASWSFDDAGVFKASGNKGEIRVKDGKITVEDQFGNCHERSIFHPAFLNSEPPPGYGGHPQQLRNMIRLVRTKGAPLCDIRKASESLAVAQSAYLSEARGKKAVALDEFKEYARQFKKPDDLLAELLKTGAKRRNDT